MSTDVSAPGKQLAKTGILVQITVSIFLSLVTSFALPSQLIAVAMGCISFVIPHSLFSYWVFRYAGATKNSLVAQSFSQGMKLKLVLTSIIFIVAYSQFNVHPLFLLGAYAIVMVSQWLAMYWAK